MTKQPKEAPRRRADIKVADIPTLLRKLERRKIELEKVPELSPSSDFGGMTQDIATRINAAMDDVFGVGTLEAAVDFHVKTTWFWDHYRNFDERRENFLKGYRRAVGVVDAAIQRLREQQEDAEEDGGRKVLAAYERLDLHRDIADAASELYRNGHYANAIEDAVKALNARVRQRSGEDGDGVPLMQSVFSAKNPILAFNDLQDESDRNEQLGFMRLFEGAVAGLRNPRAHRLIKDDPERALEFIAFVSLLAKLVDGAKRRRPQ